MATAEFIDHAGDLLETDVEVMMPISINRDTLPESEMPDALVASDVTAALSVWVDAVTAIASTDASQIAHNLSSPRSHLDEIGFDSAGDAVARAFAPFARRGNVWQRADLPKATADDASSSQRRTSDLNVGASRSPTSRRPVAIDGIGHKYTLIPRRQLQATKAARFSVKNLLKAKN